MARMIPDYSASLYSDIQWKGERDVFEALKDHTPVSWTVLHSLRMKIHNSKPVTEADFVVLTDSSVIVLEVKGGKIRRDSSGKWIQEKKGSDPIIKYDGPFKQASDTMYNLKNYLKNECKREDLAYSLNWGSGVITPHCKLEIPGNEPELDELMILNQKAFPQDMHRFCLELCDYWKKRNSRNGKRIDDKFSDTAKRDLINLLRPELTSTSDSSEWMDRADQEMVIFSEKQKEILDFNIQNQRILINGPSGTGKTLIAYEQALRKSQEGKKVLFVCFNRNLADFLKQKASEDDRMENVTIGNYHQIITSFLKKAGLGNKISNDWKSFNEECISLIDIAFSECPGLEIWDYLIVDEAQDLINNQFLSVLDKLVVDGFEKGTWLFACDNSQNIYNTFIESDTYNKIIERCSITSLNKNYRNTDRIAEYIQLITKVGSDTTRLIHGEVPTIDYYKDNNELATMLQQYVNEEIKTLVKAGRNPSELIILTPKKEMLPNKCFDLMFFDKDVEQYPSANKDVVLLSTIHSFKGLESPCVILIGFEELDSEVSRRLFYIGAGRAKFRLIWLAPEDLSDTVLNRISKGDL